MLDNSDLVIRSEIISIADTTVTLRVDEILKGKLTGKTIELKKIKDWPCASRHHEYKIGQKQINILKHSKEDIFRGMNPGNEGELPIDSNFIYCKSLLNSESEFKNFFGKIGGFKFKLEESVKGLKRIIQLSENISSKEKNCKLFGINSLSAIESMIIEEQILRMRMKYNCKINNKFKFKVLNQQMFSRQ